MDEDTTDLPGYCRMFAPLKHAPEATFGQATRHKASYKPLLLLSIIDLIARGSLKNRIIDITGDFDEPHERFTVYGHSSMPLAHRTSIAFPFSRLHNELFWKFVTNERTPMT